MEKGYIDNKQRRLIILNRLVHQEHLSYQKLSEEYFVSRSSIANDLAFIKEIFQKEGFSLTFDNSGTYFEGKEIQIQKILKRAVLGELQNGESIKVLLDDRLLNQVTKAFQHALDERKIEISESYIQNIDVAIAIMIQRSQEGYPIEEVSYNQQGKLFLEFNKYPIIYDLLQEIEAERIYIFSLKEVQYLTYLIVGSGFSFFMKNDSIPFAFKGKVRNLIQKISEGLHTDLTQDSRLEEDLTIHLYQLVMRLEADTSVVNPLIKEIKANYPALYGVVWFSVTDFCKPYQIYLSDDEIGFITIHFQAALERQKKMNKILFVCPNGLGISSFISAKIRRILPDIDSIEIVSIAKLKRLDISEVDFIISTIPIADQRKPVVTISPMVTAEDMKRIMNYYIDFILEAEVDIDESFLITEETQQMMAENIFFGDVASKEEALTFLIEQQMFANDKQKNRFFRSVLEREKVQSTYLDNGFAIPHGDPFFVEKTAISILILDKAIQWEQQKVDIIALLMIREEDAGKVEEVMKVIMEGMKDKRWFISKMIEVKK